MQLTDQVYVIKEFIYNGNRYAASKRPYLYGELPKSTRDNRSFVVPVNEVEITSSIPIINITRINGTPAEINISKENITRTLVLQVEELAISPTEELVDLSPVITEDNSDTIPNIMEQTKAIRKAKVVIDSAG